MPAEEVYFEEAEPVSLEVSMEAPSKRQSLIPFPRVGRAPRRAAGRSFHRRLLRSALGSAGFKRRVTRSGEQSSAFGRRILRDTAGREGFRRRLTKRQSLIPFPRTGKRSGETGEEERDQVRGQVPDILPTAQVYIYEAEEEEEPATEASKEEEEEGLGSGGCGGCT